MQLYAHANKEAIEKAGQKAREALKKKPTEKKESEKGKIETEQERENLLKGHEIRPVK